MKFLGQGFQKLEHEQYRHTQRQTNKCDGMHYHAMLVDGNTLTHLYESLHICAYLKHKKLVNSSTKTLASSVLNATSDTSL